MKISALFLAVFLSLNVAAAEDDWLGVENYGGHLGIYYGVYEGDSDRQSINITIPLFSMSQLHAFYSDDQSNESGFQSKSQQLGLFWNSDPQAKVSWGFGVEESGRSSNLLTRDKSLYFQYMTGSSWGFRIKAIDGESELDIGGITPEIEGQISALGLDTIDRRGLELSSNFEGENWGLQFSLGYYDYDDMGSASQGDIDDLTQLITEASQDEVSFYIRIIYLSYLQYYRDLGYAEAEALELTRDKFESDRAEIRIMLNRWTQNAVDYQFGVNEKNVLSNHDIALDYYWTHEQFMLSSGVFVYQSYIDEDYSTQIYAGVNYQMSRLYNIGCLVSYSDNSSEMYAEFSIGLDW